MMVIIPIDANVNKAQDIADQGWDSRSQSRQLDAMWNLQLEDEHGDDDGEHAITERLKPTLVQRQRALLGGRGILL